VVVLHSASSRRAQQARAAVCGRFLELNVAALDVGTQQGAGPLGGLEVFQGGIDVIGQEPLGLTKIVDFGGLSLDAGLKTE